MSHNSNSSSSPRSYIDPPQGFKFMSKLKKPSHVLSDVPPPLGGFALPPSAAFARSPDTSHLDSKTITSPTGPKSRHVTAWTSFLVAAMVLLVGYFFFQDVNLSIFQLQKAIKLEAESCYRRYAENNCLNPLEMVEGLCREWRVCMEREIEDIRILEVVASRIGLVIGSFADALSLKASVIVGAGLVIIMKVYCS
ncbi:hypothetical protein PM082_022733 [Marasmius tenuissimus]|nr:hypothetical protein PM082_022733 [Marasmius tenuissimus]